MQCAYANIGTADQPRLIHYRTAGTGPPLVMLHASPLSAKMLMPLANALTSQVTVLALDTPGYGLSDPLPADPSGQGLTQYVEALEQFRLAMGFEEIGVYGTATGAQIGVGYARAYPKRCAYFIADNAAHFSEQDRATMLDGYFPDLSIDGLGGHLLRTWSLARDQMLFFPWQDHSARLPQGGLNPAFANNFANQILAAGPNYAWAYREAFVCENVALLLEVSVPTTVMRWEGSIVKPYTDLFDDYQFADNFCMLQCGPTMENRIEGLIKAVSDHLAQLPNTSAASVGTSAAEPRTYLGDIHLHVEGAGKPLLILHQPGFSAAAIGPLTAALSAHRRCAVPDLPGHGASGPAKNLVEDVASMYQKITEMLGTQPEVLAVGESAGLGAMLANRYGCELTLLNPRPIDSDARAVPDLAPKNSGSHWVEAWHWLRMRQMFSPWYDPQPANAVDGIPLLDGATLTRQLNALLACADLAGCLSQLAVLPKFDSSVGRWLTLAHDPLGAAALRAFPDAPWQPSVSLKDITTLF